MILFQTSHTFFAITLAILTCTLALKTQMSRIHSACTKSRMLLLHASGDGKAPPDRNEDERRFEKYIPTSPKEDALNGRNMLFRTLKAGTGAVIGSGLARRANAFCTCGKDSSALCTCKSCTCGEESALCTCKSKGLLLADKEWYNPVNERIFDTSRKSYLPARPDIYLPKELNNKRIVTIGEVHSNPCHHRLEFEVVKAIAATNSPGKSLAIGLECFYRQHQASLDRFIYSHHDMGTLKKETQWTESWGYDLNYYAKIFNFAAKRKIRLVGLNVPYPVARLVSQVGLNNLPQELRVLMPEIDLGVTRHRTMFDLAMKGGAHGPSSDSDAMNRMYETQTLWDEYMAESAANYAHTHPNDMLVVIAGLGHVSGRVGIPDRIYRRTKAEPFVIVPQQVDWNAENGLPDVQLPLTTEDCDWAWYTEKEIAYA